MFILASSILSLKEIKNTQPTVKFLLKKRRQRMLIEANRNFEPTLICAYSGMEFAHNNPCQKKMIPRPSTRFG